MRGPIDYITVGFEGNNFSGRILEELKKARDNGTISVLGIALITRDLTGVVTRADTNDERVAELLEEFDVEGNLIDEDDVQEVGELLEDGTSAGFLIIEHVWAKGLKQAIIDANGTLVSEGRIHPDAEKELSNEGAE